MSGGPEIVSVWMFLCLVLVVESDMNVVFPWLTEQQYWVGDHCCAAFG